MAQETKVEETLCSLQTFERNRYFYGKPMTVSDFEAEQRYLIGKQRYINRLVHGAGVLCGLQVTTPATGFNKDRPAVEVAEGAALDCCGNLVINSRTSTVEIKGDFDPEVVNYLFIKYAECSKQPVMLAANGSSCEEVCCYNRIQETFEIVATTTAPAVAPAPPPQTKPAPSPYGPPPDPQKVCHDLMENYYEENLKTCPGCDDPLVFLAVLDAKEGAIDEAKTAKYRSVVFNNSMLHELLCDHLTDYNNPHRTTAEQVRALQSVNGVGNNTTRDHVANINLKSTDEKISIKPDVNAKKIELSLGNDAVEIKHLNVDVINHLLLSSQTVTVAPNPGAKTIKLNTTPAASVTSVAKKPVVGTSSSYAPEDHAHDLSEGVVERRHFDAEVFEHLIQGGGIINVESQPAAHSIKISADVAPGDDLKQLSSVNGKKQVGVSQRYAREDHAHDLYINGLSPNGVGKFVLTPGPNVTIVKGADNELVISAEGGSQTVIATGVVDFDNVMPQDMRSSDFIEHGLDSVTVAVIVAEEDALDLRNAAGEKFDVVKNIATFGHTFAFSPEAPFLMARVNYGLKSLQVSLRDRRQSQTAGASARLAEASGFEFTRDKTAPQEETKLSELSDAKDPSGIIDPTREVGPTLNLADDMLFPSEARNYRVRWWAIPA